MLKVDGAMWILKCSCGDMLAVNWGGYYSAKYAADLREIANDGGWSILGEIDVVTDGQCPKCKESET